MRFDSAIDILGLRSDEFTAAELLRHYRQAALLHEKNIELENANLQRLSMLIELGQQLAAERDPAQLLQKFCHAARDIVGTRYAAVGMFEEDGRTLRHFFVSGLVLTLSLLDRVEQLIETISGRATLG